MSMRGSPGLRLFAVVAATAVIDQASKALGWRTVEGAVVNPGCGVIAPWLDTTFAGPLTGAAMDLVSVLVLATVAFLTVRRCRDPLLWWAAALTIAGWTSNLLDRLGVHWLTAPGSRRGVVDWLYGHNLADLVIWVGAALAVAWLGREMLRDVGWDLRRPRRRLGVGFAVAALTGLVVAGMASVGGRTERPTTLTRAEPAPDPTQRCENPTYALSPPHWGECAHDADAAQPVEVTSTVTCPGSAGTAVVHVTITNPNRVLRAQFGFAASGDVVPVRGTAPRGRIDHGAGISAGFRIEPGRHSGALYLETAVEAFDTHGALWIPGTRRLWTADFCGGVANDADAAQVHLLCDATGTAHVVLTPRQPAFLFEEQPVTVSWRGTAMEVTTPGSSDRERARASGFTLSLADQTLHVVHVRPHTASDVLVIEGWGMRTLQHGDAPPARKVVLPVGGCLTPGWLHRPTP